MIALSAFDDLVMNLLAEVQREMFREDFQLTIRRQRRLTMQFARTDDNRCEKQDASSESATHLQMLLLLVD